MAMSKIVLEMGGEPIGEIDLEAGDPIGQMEDLAYFRQQLSRATDPEVRNRVRLCIENMIFLNFVTQGELKLES
jgi:hypothetical protein